MNIRMALTPLAFMVLTGWAYANGDVVKVLSETIYVPAYSEVLVGPGSSQQMAITIIVHNVDPDQPVTLQVVDYYDDSGQQAQNMLTEAISIPPFGSWKHLIGIRDKTGGVGANFLINWTSEAPANSPIAEALMIGGTGTHGISFTSRGQVISRENGEASQN